MQDHFPLPLLQYDVPFVYQELRGCAGSKAPSRIESLPQASIFMLVEEKPLPRTIHMRN